MGDDVFLILLRGQDLGKDGPQLHLTQYAAALYVGEHLLKVSHPLGQGLHLAHGLVYLLQPLVDQGEGLGHALIQRLLELIVHHLAHFLQPPPVVLPQGLKLAVHAVPDGGKLAHGGLAAVFEPVLRLAEALGYGPSHFLPQGRHVPGGLGAVGGQGGVGVPEAVGEALTKVLPYAPKGGIQPGGVLGGGLVPHVLPGGFHAKLL